MLWRMPVDSRTEDRQMATPDNRVRVARAPFERAATPATRSPAPRSIRARSTRSLTRCPPRPTSSAARCAASPGRNRIFRALWRPKIRSTALSAPLGEKVDEVRKGRKGRKPPAPTRCFGFVNDLDRYRQARCGRRFELLGGAATVCCPAVSPKACTSGEFPVEHMPSLAEIAETGFRRFRPSGCCAPM